MKRTRVTNAFINFLHHTGLNYDEVIDYFNNFNNFKIEVIDYDHSYKQLGRIVASGNINGNNTNIFMYSNKSYRCSD